MSSSSKAVEQASQIKRKGDEAFVKSKFEQAVGHYTDALALIEDLKAYDHRQKGKIYSARGECFVRLGRFSEAIKDCNDAMKSDSKNMIKARLRRSKAYIGLKKHRDALNDLKFVLKKQSENKQALELMRQVQRKLGMGTGGKKDSKLDYDPETDVSWEDQQLICRYNILNKVKVELEDSLGLAQEGLTEFKDAQEAMELVLDEDTSRIALGTGFFAVSDEECEDYVKNRISQLKSQMKADSLQLSECIDKLVALRAKLKKKFGDHIGLPEIKPSKHAGKR